MLRSALYDSSEPPWWLNGETPPADWTVRGSLMFHSPNGPDDGWVGIEFPEGTTATELLALLAATESRSDNAGEMTASLPDVTRSWLRFDDVTCVRGGRHWAGPEGDPVYVVEGEGCVCDDHITDDEKARARPQR